MANPDKKLNLPLKIFFNKSCLLPPLINFKANFEVSRGHNLATCQIEKVMSTFRSAMFCYLNRRQEFEKAGRSISTEHWSNTLCHDEREKEVTFNATMRILSKNPVLFTVVRQPIDRFLSGFVNKCIREKRLPGEKCFGCESDLNCFIERLYANLIAYYTKSKKLTSSEIFYIRHFAPTNWYCELRRNYDKLLVLRYDIQERKKLAADFVAVLSQAGVPLDQRMYIRGELLKRLPIHSTSNSDERKNVESRLLTDLRVLCIFTQIYYYDFVIFEYGFPKQLCFCPCWS